MHRPFYCQLVVSLQMYRQDELDPITGYVVSQLSMCTPARLLLFGLKHKDIKSSFLI